MFSYLKIFCTLACALFLILPATVYAEEPRLGMEQHAGQAVEGVPDEYRTPLAGDELRTTFLDYPIHIPARNRDNVFAVITLGGIYFTPRLGGADVLPIGAANRTIFSSPQQKSSEARGDAFSVGLSSGFLWQSQVYLEYTRDNGFLRNGASGNSLLVLWSKIF